MVVIQHFIIYQDVHVYTSGKLSKPQIAEFYEDFCVTLWETVANLTLALCHIL